MTVSFELVPYRFSSDPRAMIAFLRLLGLAAGTTIPGDRFAVLRGRSGGLAVHHAGAAVTGAQPGQTQLSFEASDAPAAADALAELRPVVWDESYGRHVGVRTPRGDGVWINEVMRDHYGYQQASGAQASGVDVVAVYLTTDFAGSGQFFKTFGFVADGAASDGWQELRAGPRDGVIGLHATPAEPSSGTASPDDPVGPPCLIGVAFETTEPLPQLRDRLHAAGFLDATLRDQPRIDVTDPDGQRIEIHPVR
jgi:hypothetical protein